MAETENLNPYQSFKYKLAIDDKQVAAFSEASIPDTMPLSVGLRAGTAPNTIRKLSGLDNYGALCLKRGVTHSMEFITWCQNVTEEGAGGFRKNLCLSLLDEAGKEITAWNIINAWPSKYELGGLQEQNSASLIMVLELQLESMERVDIQPV